MSADLCFLDLSRCVTTFLFFGGVGDEGDHGLDVDVHVAGLI